MSVVAAITLERHALLMTDKRGLLGWDQAEHRDDFLKIVKLNETTSLSYTGMRDFCVYVGGGAVRRIVKSRPLDFSSPKMGDRLANELRSAHGVFFQGAPAHVAKCDLVLAGVDATRKPFIVVLASDERFSPQVAREHQWFLSPTLGNRDGSGTRAIDRSGELRAMGERDALEHARDVILPGVLQAVQSKTVSPTGHVVVLGPDGRQTSDFDVRGYVAADAPMK